MLGRILGGRYEIEEMLGRGGMAAVWRGRDLRLDRPVAIKVLAAEVSDPTAFERMDREARIVAQLAHPSIVAVYDFGTDKGDPYLVMELVEGCAVRAMLADGPLPIVHVLAIAIQTCDGLSAAHAAGVIHRDIKPANLIVTPAGMVKICDFGIARLQRAAGQPNLTGTATAIGTTAYMAPEQAAGGPVDARTDLYALGCTMYAMLTGKPPFVGDSAHSVLQQQLACPPTPLHLHRADIPPKLDALVGELLAKNPADRPTHAGQVMTRLAALSGDPATALGGAAAPRLALQAQGEQIAGNIGPAVAKPVAASSDPYHPHRLTRARRPRRLGITGVVIVVVAAAVLTIGYITLVNVGHTGSVARQAPAPTTSTTTTRPSRVLPAAPNTTAPTNTPTLPTDPIAEMRAAIQYQVRAGQVNPAAANDLHSKIDEIVREIAEGDINQAKDKITKLRERLTSLHREGKLSAAGYATLSTYIDLIADTFT